MKMKNGRATQIVKAMEARSASFDAAYDFASLVRVGLLPPVLKQGANSPTSAPCSVDACSIVKKARPYCKPSSSSPSHCDSVSWRDYMFKGFADVESDSEADLQFKQNFSELMADYKGMLLYSTFAAQGLVQLHEQPARTP